MVEIFCTVITACAAIICAFIARISVRTAKRADARADLRAQEGRLMLDMMHANSRLTVGTALAIKRGHANGELEEGLKAVEACDEAYNTFLERIAIAHLKK